MGFDFTLIATTDNSYRIPSHVKCVICELLLENGVGLSGCEHNACMACMEKKARKGRGTCPVDGSMFNTRQCKYVNEGTDKWLSGIKMKCPYFDGCVCSASAIALRNLRNHEEVCKAASHIGFQLKAMAYLPASCGRKESVSGRASRGDGLTQSRTDVNRFAHDGKVLVLRNGIGHEKGTLFVTNERTRERGMNNWMKTNGSAIATTSGQNVGINKEAKSKQYVITQSGDEWIDLDDGQSGQAAVGMRRSHHSRSDRSRMNSNDQLSANGTCDSIRDGTSIRRTSWNLDIDYKPFFDSGSSSLIKNALGSQKLSQSQAQMKRPQVDHFNESQIRFGIKQGVCDSQAAQSASIHSADVTSTLEEKIVMKDGLAETLVDTQCKTNMEMIATTNSNMKCESDQEIKLDQDK